MRAMRAEGFSGYKDLKLVDIPKPAISDGRVLVRITAAGVTPPFCRADTRERKHR
jgi:NADPH2:quinone reductase